MNERLSPKAVTIPGNVQTLQSNLNASKTNDKTQTDEQVWSRLLHREVSATETDSLAEALTGYFKALIQAKRNTQHG